MVSSELIQEEFNSLQKICPKLAPPFIRGEFWIIEGEYDYYDHAGNLIERFFISIHIPSDYPNTLPNIIELSNKIPRENDWHNASEGCCLSPACIIFNRLGKIQLDRWFKIFVESFFANFIYKKNFKEYPEGEFQHGAQGIIDGYKKILSVVKNEEVEQKLAKLLHPKFQGRNEPCFCQSGKKFKNCWLIDSNDHINSFNIPKTQMRHDLIEIRKHLSIEQRPILK